LHCERIDISSILNHNIFQYNSSGQDSDFIGTVSLHHLAKILISFNKIENNFLPGGFVGAIFLNKVRNSELVNNSFCNNSASVIGGMYLELSGSMLRNNIICGNIATDGKIGGIYINTAHHSIGSEDDSSKKNSLTTKLSLQQNRLAKTSDNELHVELINNTICFNQSEEDAAGIVSHSAVDIENCIVWGNRSDSNMQLHLIYGESKVTFSNIEGGYEGKGNISANPKFIDNDKYYLNPSLSPCVDAGNMANIYNDRQDPQNPNYALYPSLGTIRNDMGAWGGPLVYSYESNIKQDKIFSKNHHDLDDFNLKNYPNPFNPETTISYSLEKDGFVELYVYNSLGQKMETLVKQYQSKGAHRMPFKAVSLASGFYYVRIKSNNSQQVKKILYIK